MRKIFLIIMTGFSIVSYTQNVGIGIQTPAAPLHVKSSTFEILRLEGNNPYVSFYNGSAYKGYLWYDGTRMVLGSSTNEPVIIHANYNSSPAFFTPDGRLGLGVSNPSERLHVNGNINLNGLIKVNGISGTAGQVLTSNGASDPSWTNAALSNNVRFSVLMRSGAPLSGDLPVLVTNYNLNPSEVSIGTSSITINQSGLYHFDICAESFATVSPVPTNYPKWDIQMFYGATFPARIFANKFMQPRTSSNLSWEGSDQVSIELYISAPATIRLEYFLTLSGASSYVVNAFVAGHLISQ